jgi:hypothetical protein
MKLRNWPWGILLVVIAAAALFGGRTIGRLQGAVIPPPFDCHLTAWGATPNIAVTLSDQFHEKPFAVKVGVSVLLCTPAKKSLPPERKPLPVVRGDHLECYEHSVGQVGGNWALADQFGKKPKVHLQPSTHLCEPTDKAPVVQQ